MYSISQAAKKIGVRRQSVYRKLDRSELTGHIHDTDKGKVITPEGVEILRTLFELSPDSTETVSEQYGDSVQTPNGQHTDTYVKNIIDQLDYLKCIIAEKDKQIENLTRLTENTQILLKHEQEKNKLILESTEMKKQKSIWSIFKRHKSL